MTNWFDINEWVPPAMRRRQRVPDLGQRQPIVELLSAISAEIQGREVVYEATSSTASGVIEHFEVVDLGTAWGLAVAPSSVATAVRGEIRDPRWGDHRVDRIRFEASNVELSQGRVTEVSVELFELTVELSVPTLRRWLDDLDTEIELVELREDALVLRWRRWPRRIATMVGRPHASGRRLYAQMSEIRFPWATIDLSSGPEFHVATSLGDLAPSARLTGASLVDHHLVITAEVRDFHTPIGPDQIRAALRSGGGRITVRRND